MAKNSILRARVSEDLDNSITDMAKEYGMKRTDFIRAVFEFIRSERPDLRITYEVKESASTSLIT